MLVLFLAFAFAEPDFSSALKEISTKKVEYSSSLGEGEGAFDSRPRAVTDEINCMTWMQAVIASAYGKTPDMSQSYLDSLRYYGDTISFGSRKHYIDRWLALEPAPLMPINSSDCKADVIGSVTLDLIRFKKNHNYQGELFSEDRFVFSLDFLSPEKTTSCLQALPEGYYALFFVANEDYLRHWGKHGSMGQVHSIIVEKNEEIRIHHASSDFGKVVVEDWASFNQRILVVTQGYTIFSFDPNWTPKPNMNFSTSRKPINK